MNRFNKAEYIETDAKWWKPYHNLGNIYLYSEGILDNWDEDKSKFTKQKIQDYQKAIKEHQSNFNSHQKDSIKFLNLIEFLDLMEFWGLENYQTVLENYRTALENYPTKFNEYQTSLKNYRTKFKDYQTVLKDYQTKFKNYRTALENYRKGLENYRTRFKDYQKRFNEYQTSLKNYQTTLEAHGTSLKNYQATLETYGTSLENYRTSFEDYRRKFNEFINYNELSNYDNAIKYLQEAVELSQHRSAFALSGLGLSYLFMAIFMQLHFQKYENWQKLIPCVEDLINKALYEVQLAVDIDGENAVFYWNLGLVKLWHPNRTLDEVSIICDEAVKKAKTEKQEEQDLCSAIYSYVQQAISKNQSAFWYSYKRVYEILGKPATPMKVKMIIKELSIVQIALKHLFPNAKERAERAFNNITALKGKLNTKL